jgi:predicted TIM-barrel fold metal-dependent hydrolase
MSQLPPVSEAESVITPAQPLCDAHHHLWALPRSRYLLPQFQVDLAAGHRVVSTVYVEWRSHYRTDGPVEFRPVAEVAFARGVAEAAARGPVRVCAAIIGFADLSLGDAVRPVLEAEVAAGKGALKGLRHVASWDDDPEVLGGTAAAGPGLYLEPRFRAGFRLLEEFGLSFDAWLFQTQLDDLVDLARAFPRQPIVLNHTGGVLGIGRYAGQRDALFASWRRSIGELTRCPNVYIKLGGLGMKRCGFPFYNRPGLSTSATLAEAWRPWIETCIEAFGADRCLFESNFPVDGQSCSYRVLWNAFKRLAAGGSPAERAALLHDTATRFYRLTP